ncbi:hypothetical protein IIA15_04775 [candidate division TA06 bacterium]|nr:hypothetical protein [candidate division TA06 bacterium]
MSHKGVQISNKRKTERGVVLILVIQMGMVISLLISAWLISIQGRTHFLSQRRERLKAYYTAEAGLNKAIWTLKRNPKWRTHNSTGNLSRLKEDPFLMDSLFTTGTGECLISVVDRGTGAEITATGISGESSATLSALMIVRKDKGFYFLPYKSMGQEKTK